MEFKIIFLGRFLTLKIKNYPFVKIHNALHIL